jgi:fucose permease
MDKDHSRQLVAVAFALFVALGLSHGVLGVAWPSMRSDFTRPLSDLGTLLAVSAVGYFVAGLMAGSLTKRFGIGNVLASCMALGTLSLVGYGIADDWVFLLLSSVGVGITGGLIDSVVNAYVALNHSTRTMNLLHASFGIGAMSGPLLVASSLARGLSWRSAFVVLAAAEMLLLVTTLTVRRRWPAGRDSEVSVAEAGSAGTSVASLLGIFFLYVGVEVTAAHWSYSVLTQARFVGEFAAGVWVAAFWAGLTGGRLVLGAVGNRMHPRTTLNVSMAGTLIGILIFWWDPAGIGALGLPVLGASLAGIFPTLVALTPSWVGQDRTSTVVGQQIAASTLGAAVLPWIAGRWMDAGGLERLGPFLFVSAVLMTLLHLYVDRLAGADADVRRTGSEDLLRG